MQSCPTSKKPYAANPLYGGAARCGTACLLTWLLCCVSKTSSSPAATPRHNRSVAAFERPRLERADRERLITGQRKARRYLFARFALVGGRLHQPAEMRSIGANHFPRRKWRTFSSPSSGGARNRCRARQVTGMTGSPRGLVRHGSRLHGGWREGVCDPGPARLTAGKRTGSAPDPPAPTIPIWCVTPPLIFSGSPRSLRSFSSFFCFLFFWNAYQLLNSQG